MQDIITLQIGRTKERSSNFELYRIICMLMIVAHHFVVNSGLTSLMMENPTAANTLYLCVVRNVGQNRYRLFPSYYWLLHV